MARVEVKQVCKAVELGEGPHWEQASQSLLFVDINGGALHRYYPETGAHQVHAVMRGQCVDTVSLVVPVRGRQGHYLVSVGNSLAVVEWAPGQEGRLRGMLHTVQQDIPTARFNDGKCDPSGRLWTGTTDAEASEGYQLTSQNRGVVYCLDNDLTISPRVDKIAISNGLAWTSDKRTFFYIDSLAKSVDAFDYDNVTSQISNRRKVLDYTTTLQGPDVPDGMCIDQNDHLWVANFYGKKVINLDPAAGKILRSIEMPATNTTSVCWGGREYSTLYVTSAYAQMSPEQSAQPAEGGTFSVTGLGVKGLPPVDFKADLPTLDKMLSSA